MSLSPTPDREREAALMEHLFLGSGGAVNAPGKTPVGAGGGKALRPYFRRLPVLVGDVFRRLLDHASRVVLPIRGEDYLLRTASGLIAIQDEDVFQLQLGEQVFQLVFERIAELVEVPNLWWERIPGYLRASLVEDFFRAVLAAENLKVVYAGTTRRMEQSALPCELFFALDSRSGGRGYRGRVAFQTPAAAALLVSAWKGLAGAGEGRFANISFPVRIEIMSAVVGVAELARLQPGALVPVGAPLEGRAVSVAVGWGRRLVAPAVINNRVVTLQGEVKFMDDAQAGSAGIPLSELSRMESVDVQFSVELATCSLPLNELARLGPGSTLSLGLPHEPALVRLCVNGRAVATGELVVLGQSLGVQIVEVATA